MKMNIYAVYDKCREAIVRFDFGNTDGSFVRDNLNNDLYNPDTKTGIPLKDLEYYNLGRVDLDKMEVEGHEKEKLDILKCYEFKQKSENTVEKKELTQQNISKE